MARALEVRRVRVSKVNPVAWNPRRDLQPGDPEYEAIRRRTPSGGAVRWSLKVRVFGKRGRFL
jgi:hypothetical protein